MTGRARRARAAPCEQPAAPQANRRWRGAAGRVMVGAVTQLLPWLPVLVLAAVVPAAAPAHAASLRLMTYNLNFGNPRPETSLAAIEHEDADIVLLQEVSGAWKQALDRRFAKRYPHRAYRLFGRLGAGGIAVLSKHP